MPRSRAHYLNTHWSAGCFAFFRKWMRRELRNFVLYHVCTFDQKDICMFKSIHIIVVYRIGLRISCIYAFQMKCVSAICLAKLITNLFQWHPKPPHRGLDWKIAQFLLWFVFFLCVCTFVCVLYPHAMESSKGWAKTYEHNNSAWNKVRNLYMKKTHPSFKNARMHKYTLPAWHSNKNKTSNKITYQTHTQRQSRISANVSTECTLLFTFWTGIFCEKFRVTAMVVLKSNHSVRVCICYRCFLLL